ncbi:uncharacterized protein M6B38_405590 [Iris pallida]|uniref:BAG domain-containing protein n=1 Tax=Iris pallida TaxID=29817 RepID=A0AAX6FPN9_IRIPA|nr:uncharacterized protein M6B38_405590 [Iris pallida]
MYYRNMGPHPQSFNHQRPPHSHPGQYHPFWEAMPPPTTTDLHHPSGFGHFPCPNPAEHGGCCNYSYPPGYHSFRPAYSYIPPPPPLYYHTPYAPHPDSYPAYSVPPPHYSLDQPRYDYDKARHHCCGCPNHSCHQKDDRPVKIEEQVPEEEQNRGSSSLIQSPNHNFPILWVPPEYMKGKGNLNGWVPLDINSLKGTKPDGEEKKQPPSPIIWMPSNDKPMEAAKDVKEISPTPKSMEEWPSKLKIIPLKFLENGDQDKKPRIVEETKSGVQPGVPTEKESSRTKNIPVKHLENGDQAKKPRVVEDESRSGVQPEVPAEKESSRTKNIPVKHLEERNQKKTSTPEKPKGKDENEVKKASENKSTVKSSKLPPVCLRVDPLPRRKTTNGKSRSSSPAELEGGRAHQPNERSKEPVEEIAKVKDVPVSDMKGNTASQEAKEQKCQVSVPASSGVAVVEEACKNENLQATQEVVDMSEHPATEQRVEFLERNCSERDQEAAEKGQNMEGKKEGRMLELDAAVIIQSAYRGFQVRRWQPLEKLRKIAKIREQMLSIRRQIESTEAFKDAKQRVVISETIMNLLLQLDTIQGLHPTVREARKAVARELVCLEEKLDSLVNLAAEDHESVNAKTNVADENSDDHLLSCPETKSTTKRESLEEMVASVGCTDNSERAKVSKQPTEVDSNVEHPPFENEESNRSADDGVAIIASPSLVTVQVPEEKLQVAADGNGSPDQPILNDNEGKRIQEAEVEEEKSHIEEGGNGFPEQQILDNNEAESCQGVDEGKKAEEVEAVETTAEELHIAEAGSITNTPFKEDGSSNASAYEDNVSPGVNGRCQEVNGEEHIGEEEESVESGGLDNRNIVHESEELPLHASGEESDISKDALLRVEEAKSDAERHLLIAPAEDEIDRKLDKPLEFKEAAHAEDEPQVSSTVGGDDCQSEMPAELECVAGLNSRPGDAVGGDNKTAVDNSGMLTAEYGTNPPEEEPVCGGSDGSLVVCEGNKDPTCEDSHDNVIKAVASTQAFEKEASPVVLEATSEATEAPVLEDRGAVDVLDPVGASEEKKLIEENEKLREMLEKLLEAGKEQLGVISSLNGRVKDLERKLAQKKRVKVKRNRAANKIHS